MAILGIFYVVKECIFGGMGKRVKKEFKESLGIPLVFCLISLHDI